MNMNLKYLNCMATNKFINISHMTMNHYELYEQNISSLRIFMNMKLMTMNKFMNMNHMTMNDYEQYEPNFVRMHDS